MSANCGNLTRSPREARELPQSPNVDVQWKPFFDEEDIVQVPYL